MNPYCSTLHRLPGGSRDLDYVEFEVRSGGTVEWATSAHGAGNAQIELPEFGSVSKKKLFAKRQDFETHCVPSHR
jgi:hypothetical protein